MAFKKVKSAKKVEPVVKAAPPVVDMAEEEVASEDKIAVVPPKPTSTGAQKPGDHPGCEDLYE